MTTSDDEEFRSLFALEAEQRLARLGQELLQLEEAGGDEELLGSIFRDAHTIKGAAAVVGLDEVSRVAHAMEDLLEDLRSGRRLAGPALIDVLLGAVDGLRHLIPALLGGQDRSAEAAQLEHVLHAAALASPPLPVGGEVGESRSEPNGGSPPERAVPAARVEGADAPLSGPTSGGPGSGGYGDRRIRPDEAVLVPVSRLDELVDLVGESAAANLRIGRMLTERFNVDPGAVSEFRDLSRVLNDLQERTMRIRMVPVSTITDSLRRSARDLARAQGKDIRWEMRGGDTELDRGVLRQLADPLMHLVRNAIDHGIESPAERSAALKPEQATVRLHAMQLGSEVVITVADDGRGIDREEVRSRVAHAGTDLSGTSDEDSIYLIFRSGVSTARFVSDISGRGVGLDVVRSGVDAVRGRVEVHSEPGVGTEFRVIVPITLAVLRCLLVRIGSERYAIPMHSVVMAQGADAEAVAHAEGRSAVWVDGSAIPLSSLAVTLWGGEPRPPGEGEIVVLAGLTRRHAFQVDGLVGQRDVVVKGLGKLLPRLDVLAGASVEPDGSILLVLDTPGLIDRARMARGGGSPRPDSGTGAREERRGTILVVDDALTVRELQRSILERAGYEVKTAADGIEALARLAEGPCDLLLADVEMPRMDGFALTEAVRAHPSLGNLPVLLITSRAGEDDRKRGLEAGADGYIVKSAFDETALLAAISRFLGTSP